MRAVVFGLAFVLSAPASAWDKDPFFGDLKFPVSGRYGTAPHCTLSTETDMTIEPNKIGLLYGTCDPVEVQGHAVKIACQFEGWRPDIMAVTITENRRAGIVTYVSGTETVSLHRCP